MKTQLVITPAYADKQDIATLIGVSKRTVDSLLRQGCPHLKLGARKVRFDIDQVKTWLNEKFKTQRISYLRDKK
jgi:excisionase family DNA binding protein